MVSVLLPAHIERVSVSRIRDFLKFYCQCAFVMFLYGLLNNDVIFLGGFLTPTIAININKCPPSSLTNYLSKPHLRLSVIKKKNIYIFKIARLVQKVW